MGHISGVYGIQGWLKLISGTSPRHALLDFNPLYLQVGDTWQELQVEAGQIHGKGLIIKFVGYDDRDLAARLVGCEVAVQREQLPDTNPNEYYWADLLGLRVMGLDDTDLGTVSSMLETGANDVLVVQGDRERLIPFVQGQIVKEVDLHTGFIRVDWDADF